MLSTVSAGVIFSSMEASFSLNQGHILYLEAASLQTQIIEKFRLHLSLLSPTWEDDTNIIERWMFFAEAKTLQVLMFNIYRQVH